MSIVFTTRYSADYFLLNFEKSSLFGSPGENIETNMALYETVVNRLKDIVWEIAF